MANYKLSITAKEDLIRIHQYGSNQFGASQADQYFFRIFDCFEIIAERPLAFESVDQIKLGYRRCVVGLIVFFIESKIKPWKL
jgi:toxin ParE1/3/4